MIFCCFAGFARSGTSLVGSILNAHPKCAVSHELDVVTKLLDNGVSREQAFQMIINKVGEEAQKGKRWCPTVDGGKYHFDKLGLSQKKLDEVEVIGDKKAGKTLFTLCGAQISKDATVELDRLRNIVQVPIRVLICHRDPFSVFSALKMGGHPFGIKWCSFDRMMGHIDLLRKVLAPEELIEVWLEELTSKPQEELRRIFQRLGVVASDEFISSMASHVWSKPNRRSCLNESEVAEVKAAIEKYDFLKMRM